MIETTHLRNLQADVARQRETIITFLREICAIPSLDGQIGPVGERVAQELRLLGFDEVRFDRMGNILGRLGAGETVVVYDSHIDTVGIGDPEAWAWDPFEGKIEGGRFYARGACDEKGSTPGMIYGLALAQKYGLLEGFTVWYFGNMEEWCDGIAPNTFVEVDPGLRPDYVVIGEPTRMNVYRGHKGRLEMSLTAKGRSAHAASNHLGDNAIYKMLPIIEAISKLEPALGEHPFLGHGKITVSDMRVKTPSINAVPDECTIFVDRRMTLGETKEAVLAQLAALIPPAQKGSITLAELFYDEPSYTGFVFPVDKYFPAWLYEEDHPLVVAGKAAREAIGYEPRPAGKWDFSTNGAYWAGKAGIPAIGFGPGEEETAHTVMDSVLLDDVVKATEFYALLPGFLTKMLTKDAS